MIDVTTEQWEPIDYNPGISVEKWVELLNNPKLLTPTRMEVLKRLKDCKNGAACKQLSEKYGKTANFYNSNASSFAKSVFNETNCLVCHRKDESIRYWAILFWGRYEQGKTLFAWKLRDELSQALDLVDLSAVPLYADFPQDEKQILSSGKIDLPDLERAARHYASQRPVSREATVQQYHRSESVKQYAKALANGRCQLCNMAAPFMDAKGKPYLEVHHIIWLSHGGADTIENTVALCPNCHRKMHILQSADDVEKLLESISKR